jgi:hypothetical protein
MQTSFLKIMNIKGSVMYLILVAIGFKKLLSYSIMIIKVRNVMFHFTLLCVCDDAIIFSIIVTPLLFTFCDINIIVHRLSNVLCLFHFNLLFVITLSPYMLLFSLAMHHC